MCHSRTHSSSRPQLDKLKSREADRAAAFSSLLAAYAQEAVVGIEGVGPIIRQRLVSLVSVLMRLLDNFLMPDDLPPLREDGSDDWVYALPGRKHDRQLFRLAAANAEAEGVNPDAAAATGKDSKGKPSPTKTPSSAKFAKKPPATNTAPSADEDTALPRPFGMLTWTLPSGALDLQSLGWCNDPALPVVQTAQTATQAAAPVATTKPAAGGAKGAAAAAAAQPASINVTALDTPCHRAGIRAYKASISQVEHCLKEGLAQLVSELSTWSKDAALWAKTWAQLMEQLQGV